MQAAHKNNEPMSEVNAVNAVGGLRSTNAVASFNSLDSAHFAVAGNSSSASLSVHRMPIGKTLKVWGPVVVTAIVVPGGIVIALAILIRRWYRNRAVRVATFA